MYRRTRDVHDPATTRTGWTATVQDQEADIRGNSTPVQVLSTTIECVQGRERVVFATFSHIKKVPRSKKSARPIKAFQYAPVKFQDDRKCGYEKL